MFFLMGYLGACVVSCPPMGDPGVLRIRTETQVLADIQVGHGLWPRIPVGRVALTWLVDTDTARQAAVVFPGGKYERIFPVQALSIENIRPLLLVVAAEDVDIQQAIVQVEEGSSRCPIADVVGLL